MRQIVFATGNSGKLGQARFVAQAYDIDVEILNGRELYGPDLDYDEIGEHTWEVARNGAKDLADRLEVPVMVEDSDFRIPVFGGMPGIRADRFLRAHGRDGILRLMADMHGDDRQAMLTSSVGFCMPGSHPHCWTHQLAGTVAREQLLCDGPDWIGPKTLTSKGGGFNAIFIPDGWDQPLSGSTIEQGLVHGYREPAFMAALMYIASR